MGEKARRVRQESTRRLRLEPLTDEERERRVAEQAIRFVVMVHPTLAGACFELGGHAGRQYPCDSRRPEARVFGRAVGLVLVLVLLLLPGAVRPDADANIRERVDQLVLQLDADEPAARDAAGAALLQLGPEVLPYLPALDGPQVSAEQRARLRQLLPELWLAKRIADLAGSRVSLAGPTPLDEAVGQLARATDNPIVDLRPSFNQPVSNPLVELSASGLLFWRAIDEIAESAELGLYHHGEGRSIGLTARPAKLPPRDYAGAVRFAVQELQLTRNFNDPDAPSVRCSVQLEALVEPHLRPLLVELDTSALAAVDDRGKPLDYSGPATFQFVPERDLYAYELALRFSAPARDARAIDRLEGRLLLLLPAQVASLLFDLGDKEAQRKESWGCAVQVEPVQDEDGVWSVPLTIEQGEQIMPIDSHFEAALQTEVFLEDKTGKRYRQNGGMSTMPTDKPNATAVEYLFVDLPGKPANYRLIVRVLAGLVRVPVPFRFASLPLP